MPSRGLAQRRTLRFWSNLEWKSQEAILIDSGLVEEEREGRDQIYHSAPLISL